jgi:hypothetical protein
MHHELIANSFMLPPADFALPDDGWYQIAIEGTFPHKPTSLVQQLDAISFADMVSAFQRDAQTPNFPGILIDFDHDSLSKDKRSEAAGWISDLEARPGGLWARIRWTDAGLAAVKGGRYRFISPVWRHDECQDLGNSHVRPTRLCNAAVTNDPNISGMVPLSNNAHQGRAPTMHTRDSANHPVLPNMGPPTQQMTDEQRKAMFARLSGGGGGSASSSSPPAAQPPPPAPDSSTAPPPGFGDFRPAPTPLYQVTRDTAARIQALKKQREALNNARPEKPELISFHKINLRDYKNQLLKLNRPLDYIKDRLDEAKQHNNDVARRLRSLKKAARLKHPKNTNLRKLYIATQIAKSSIVYDKEMEKFKKATASLDLKDAALQLEIDKEEIRGRELEHQAWLRTLNATQRAEYDAREKQIRELVRQDKTTKAEQLRVDNERRRAQRELDSNTPDKKYRRELAARRTYWHALARGDVQQAKEMFPNADHDKNAKRIKIIRDGTIGEQGNNPTAFRAYQKHLDMIRYDVP